MSEATTPAAPAATPDAAPTKSATSTAPVRPSGAAAPSVAAKPAATKPSPTTGKSGVGAAMAASTTDATPDEGGERSEPAEPKAPERRKYKYKANGQEIEGEFTEEEIAVRLAQSEGFRKAFSERDNLKQSFAEFVQALKEDPFSVLEDPAIGLNLEDLARQRLIEKHRLMQEEAKLSPEQKALKEKEAELERYRQREAEAKRKAREVAETKMRERAEADITRTLEGALTELGVDATPESLADAARVMKLNLKHGLKLTPKQIALEVQRVQEARHERFRKAAMGNLKGERLLAALGGKDSPVIEAVLEAIGHDHPAVKKALQARLAKMRGVENFAPPPVAPAAPAEPAEKKPFDRAAWRRENIYGGR